MNRLIFSVTATLLAGALSACSFAMGNARDNSETVKVSRSIDSRIDKIDASTGIHIIYTQGTPQGMILEGRQKDIDQLNIYTEGGTLNIERKATKAVNKIFNHNKGVKIMVTAPQVNDFDMSTGCTLDIARLNSESKVDIELGTGSTLTAGTIKAPEVDIEISTGGTGKVKNLLSDDVSLDISTGSDFTVAGQGNKISIDASTGSSVDASQFKAVRANIDASTGSTVKYNSEGAKVDSSTGSTVTNYDK